MNKLVVRLATVTLATFLALGACTPGLSAQNAMGGQDSMGAQPDKAEMAAKLEKMSAALQLTPAQKEQMRPIVMEEAMQMKEVKGNTSLPPMQKAMKMHQIADAADAKVKPVLNAGQYQKWEAMRAQERQQMMQKMQNR
jgi:hypothetical protein